MADAEPSPSASAGRIRGRSGCRSERRFRVRGEPAGRPCGASLCVEACWEAGAGPLCVRAFGPAGSV